MHRWDLTTESIHHPTQLPYERIHLWDHTHKELLASEHPSWKVLPLLSGPDIYGEDGG